MNNIIFRDDGHYGPLECQKGVVSFIKTIFSGPPKPKAPQMDPAVAAAQRRQMETIKQQEAVIARERQSANRREEELSGQAAAQRRALAARGRGRGGLSFTGGSAGGMKTTLGG